MNLIRCVIFAFAVICVLMSAMRLAREDYWTEGVVFGIIAAVCGVALWCIPG